MQCRPSGARLLSGAAPSMDLDLQCGPDPRAKVGGRAPLISGALLTDIKPGGPAFEERILREGDKIIAIDGNDCRDVAFQVRDAARWKHARLKRLLGTVELLALLFRTAP